VTSGGLARGAQRAACGARARTGQPRCPRPPAGPAGPRPAGGRDTLFAS
jgi:hypothetical protein